MTTETEDSTRFDELVDGIRVAMLTSPDGSGQLHGRPLTVQKVEDGVVWFLVDAEAAWLSDGMGTVNLAFADGDTWVSAAASATLVRDPKVLEELGDPVSGAWFDEGTQPAALKVDVQRADFWDAPGKVVQLLQMGKAALTQNPPDMGERGVVEP